MSLSLEFEPHSYYMGFAIEKTNVPSNDTVDWPWNAYSDNGNTYMISVLHAVTKEELYTKIRSHHLHHHNNYGERIALGRLRTIRESIENENISYAETAELQSLIDYIGDDDVQLLEWTGVKES